jgi:hypothetical protein
MGNTITLRYTMHHGQMIWKGKTASGNFAATMVNTPEELLAFGRRFFPGYEVKIEAA